MEAGDLNEGVNLFPCCTDGVGVAPRAEVHADCHPVLHVFRPGQIATSRVAKLPVTPDLVWQIFPPAADATTDRVDEPEHRWPVKEGHRSEVHTPTAGCQAGVAVGDPDGLTTWATFVGKQFMTEGDPVVSRDLRAVSVGRAHS